MYRVTIQVVTNLPLTSKQKINYDELIIFLSSVNIEAICFVDGSDLIPGAHGWLGPAIRGGAAVIRAASRRGGSGKGSPKGGHKNNQRPSNREKHQNGDSRRQRDQQRSNNPNKRRRD